jgi:predicted metalloprotease with PDZ domain
MHFVKKIQYFILFAFFINCLFISLFPIKSFSFTSKEITSDKKNNNVSKLKYFLKVTDLASHLFEVKIQISGNNLKELDFAMPAWSPGRYVIFNFSKNVQDFSVQTQAGKVLFWQKVDKQTWRVETQGESNLEIKYKIFADDLSGTFSQLNQDHANFNGASLFMYLVGHKENPIELKIEKPNDWKIINSATNDINQTEFYFENYDVLIDTPTEIGKFDLETFQIGSSTYKVMLHNYHPFNEKNRLVQALKQIIEAQTNFLGEPDPNHYTFLIHVVSPTYPTDGMEHLNSTQIIDSNLDGIVETASHEFFHLWNVKRLRPIELGPWDYSQEVYTKSLWIAEGLTSYYGDLFLLRSGYWSKEKFYSFLSEQISLLESRPGRKQTSLEQSSLDTWLFVATPKSQTTNEEQITISYYNKGEIVGLMLDLEIRNRTSNLKSLDDVFIYLYKEYYLNSLQTSYYLKGRGYAYEDFLKAVNKVSGLDFTDFFQAYVSGTKEINYNTFFSYAGLYIEGSNYDREIKENPKATKEQVEIRNSWLSKIAKAKVTN